MSLIPQQSRTFKDRAFGVACVVLGGMAFILLLMVGISFSLAKRTITVEKVVQVPVPVPGQGNERAGQTTEPAVGSEDVTDTQPRPIDVSDDTGEQPRTVEEMLRESDMADPAMDQPYQPETSFTGDEQFPPGQANTQSADDVMPAMTVEVANLVKAARYAQIEGDMRLAVLKLEQAMRLEPENPVVLYYYGLTYEWLRNADKSREFFLKVYMQREKAGKYFVRAARHLQSGFSSPADVRGDMAFGPISEYKDPDCATGERIKLIVPILMKDGLNVRPEDLHIRIQFFDKVNSKKVEMTRAPQPTISWATDPVDWSDGEEIMEITYYMPPLTEEELIAFGSLKYYGYTAKLYYKGEPMDCHASPPVLFLLEQMKHKYPSSMPEFYEGDDSLLPPVEAVPVSDTYEEGLLP